MGMTKQHDYKREFDNFQLAKSIDTSITEKDFAVGLRMSYTTISSRFAPFNQQLEEDEIRQTLRKITKSAHNKVNKFIESFEPQKIQEADTLSMIGARTADRIGFSPQASTINIQNNQNNKTDINLQMNIFPNEYKDEFTHMFGGNEDGREGTEEEGTETGLILSAEESSYTNE